MIPPEFKDELLARTDIVDIIEARVPLKKTGKDYLGLCPFHQEKTPSFNVNQEKQFYYCFGCQASGSALDFLIKHDRMEFIPAMEHLAQRVGMKLPQNQSQDPGITKKHKAIYELLGRCTDFYKQQLSNPVLGSPAVSYLKGRQVSGRTARDFALGFAPPGWDNLLSYMQQQGAESALLADAGMVKAKPEEGKLYDRFRDRIIFPIRDTRGRTVAFGGRSLSSESMPKYLNSPETEVFHKGRVLYGLYEARRQASHLAKLVVVEGYMDVVALAQHGIGYSIATLGTATSTDQVTQMFRLVPQIVFCFDGDNAGRKAGWKALLATLPAMQDGKSVKFLFLPEGDDPDSLVRREGKEQFEARIEQGMSLVDYLFSGLEAELDMDGLEAQAALCKLAAPLIQELPEGALKHLVINELARKTGLEVEQLLRVTGLDQPPPAPKAPAPARRSEPARASQRSRVDLLDPAAKLRDKALSIMLRYPEVALSLNEGELQSLSSDSDLHLFVGLVKCIQQMPRPSTMLILSHYEDTAHHAEFKRLAEKDETLPESAQGGELDGTVKKYLARIKKQIKQQSTKDPLAKLPSELSSSERQLITGAKSGEILEK